jgi:NAD(P)-dependent dehydrogenase (short-subunit alcohol dehydrogenase family)
LQNSDSLQNGNNASVLITGCSSGIGEVCARVLAAEGYRVFATARGSASRLDPLARGCEAEGAPLAGTFALDVNDMASCRDVVNQVCDRAGGVDILINNAGYGLLGPLERLSLEDIRAQFETNVVGLIGLTQLVLPCMRDQGFGKIINVGSIMGHVTYPFGGAYAATKHAVAGITKTMRMELAPFGIQATVVEPGGTASEFRTGSRISMDENAPEDSPYFAFSRQVKERLDSGDPEPTMTAVNVILRAVKDKKMAPRYLSGKDARKIYYALRVLPSRLSELLLWKAFKPRDL